MIQSESEPIPLEVSVVETTAFEALLMIADDGQYELTLRHDLCPKAVETIQAKASEIIKAEADSLPNNKVRGKLWLNGKWRDCDVNLTAVYDEVLNHWQVSVVITDRPH